MSVAPSATQPALSLSDHQLVAAVRAGSDAAFEELYSRYHRRIGSYVLRSVRDHARAEDLVQDVFIAALRRLRDTERPIAFKPWIYEIAKNACLDEYRRSGRVREVPFEGQPEPVELLRSPATPEVAVESKQRLENLRGAFQGLSESHHRILVLRELEGLSYQEIGERLGVSGAVVESTLFRARRRLSSEYEELVSGRRCEQVQAAITDGDRPLRALGLRQRRRLARHLSHCQPCRRSARAAGVDEKYFHAPSVARRLAALLPLPWLRLRRGGRHGSATDRFAGMLQLQSLAQLGDSAPPMIALGRAAAAAAAAVVIGGAGGGFLTGLHVARTHAQAASTSGSHPDQPMAPTAVDGAAAFDSEPSAGASAVGGAVRGAPGAPTGQARQVLGSLLAALEKALPSNDPAKPAIASAISQLAGVGSSSRSTPGSNQTLGSTSTGSSSMNSALATAPTLPASNPVPAQLGPAVQQATRPLRAVVPHRSGGGGTGASRNGGSGNGGGSSQLGSSSGSGSSTDGAGGGGSESGGSGTGGGGAQSNRSGSATPIHAQPQN